jgi:hypothetical protein
MASLSKDRFFLQKGTHSEHQI